MAAPTTTGVPLGLMTVTVSKESTQSRVIILRSFLYTIADGQEKQTVMSNAARLETLASQ
jgi:hypothetical protein